MPHIRAERQPTGYFPDGPTIRAEPEFDASDNAVSNRFFG
jgi:hypothetical protein